VRTTMPPKKKANAPTTINIPGFTRGGILGKGSFATVVLYTRDVDNKDFAVKGFSKKRLQRQRKGPKRNALMDVQREVAIMKKLTHPNLVHLEMVIDVPEEDCLMLVMEHLSGGVAMGGKMHEKALDEGTARSCMRDALCGLEFLHFNNILHLDIKPENMLLDHNGRIKLVDFGVSKQLDEEAEDDMITGSVGTPTFWAPECCIPGQVYSGKKADVWALGVTLYQFMTGKVPFVATTADELRNKILNDEPEIVDAWSDDLKEILGLMMEKNFEKRITMTEAKKLAWTVDSMGALPELDHTGKPIKVSQKEVRNAFITIGTLLKVVGKMKGLLKRKFKRSLGREVEKRPPRHKPLPDGNAPLKARQDIAESLAVWCTVHFEPFIAREAVHEVLR